MASVTKYEPVHSVTRAKAASNPSGLKNVARIKLIVAALFFTIGVCVHKWIFLEKSSEILKFLENFAFNLYITSVIKNSIASVSLREFV